MTQLVAVLACASALAGCVQDSGDPFRLPDGDAQRGREAFVALRCHACHEIEGVPFIGTGATRVTLGGGATTVETYEELVTSIINPSHRITPRYPAEQVTVDGQSLMALAYLNDVMTVQQLIDLVAFVQSSYYVVPPRVNPYTRVYP